MSNTEIWHYRGREARGLGKPCVLTDGRISPAARRAWIEGWRAEEALRNPPPPPTEEEIADSKSFFDLLKAELRTGATQSHNHHPCAESHKVIEGPRIPARWGTFPTQVCEVCGMWRIDPSIGPDGWKEGESLQARLQEDGDDA